ncbi:MAG TPA: endo alpha-1,4 polygalactosaminidase [Stellaceae bacterium]|jgi:uncharacterized protein (TIGR01370 family)|nr:endo alpha-1,4 polygalactosaminidase [Stellaceae bacterium]
MTSSDAPAELASVRWSQGRGLALRRTLLKAFGALVAGGSISQIVACVADKPLKWVAFYGETADEDALSLYDIVVLDPAFKGSIGQVAKGGARVCSYISLGEIRNTHPLFGSLDRAALLDENPAWPGTFRVDVRHPAWSRIIIENAIPDILSKQFTGLLLDTLDTAAYLESLDPERYRGMRRSAENLVRSIRKSYPNLLVLMNRGYALLPAVTDCVDGMVAESLLTESDSHHNTQYKWNDESDVLVQLSLLTPAKRRRLPILSLDYWNVDDTKTIREIYGRERQLGFHPYVATRMLDKIVPEPT